jgi:hypothetical protein
MSFVEYKSLRNRAVMLETVGESQIHLLCG